MAIFTLYNVLSALLLADCFVLVFVVLKQKKRSAGLGSMGVITANNSQTYWEKNKGRSKEGTLEFATKIAATIFFLLPLALLFVK